MVDWGTVFPGVPDCLDRTSGTPVATLACIPVVLRIIINAALVFSGVTALFFIIFSGIKFITSGGDPKIAEGARHTLTYAIIGLLLILLSFFIINVLGTITGVGCITKLGFSQCN